MGKSDKKVKSDRINALRKQYDAFLEDDKKRKERNEYILEKLDKMRYCTAMVQVRQKAPIYVDNRKVSLYNMREQTLDSPTGLPQNNVDTPRRVDETVLLHEISKKYILIPKLTQSYAKEYSNMPQLKIDENIDWKSKYDILEKLKRDEKEQDSPVHQEPSLLEPKEKASTVYYKENDIKQNDELLLEYQNELPVKLPPEDQIPYELQDYAKENTVVGQNYDNSVNDTNEVKHAVDTVYCDNNLQNVVYEGNIYDDGNTKSNVYDQNVNVDSGLHQDNIDNFAYDQIPSKDDAEFEYSNTQEANPNNVKYDLDVDKLNNTSVAPLDEYNLQTENENIYAQDEPTGVIADSITHEDFVDKEEQNNNLVDNQVYPDQQELVHNIDATDMINEINNETPSNEEAKILATNVEHPIEVGNVQAFTPQDHVQIVEGENVSAEPQMFIANSDLTQHYDPAIDPANIHEEAFNNEQNEQFYTEQTENYDYDKEGITENYNTETVPTENYQQNEEYAYYEGAPPEQPYAEINDNAEITQQYDQNYEQQYGTEYDQQAYQQQGYEQGYAQGYEQQVYTEPEQQYETQNQVLEDVQYDNQDNLTPQYVEQKLDNEEGYVETTNATAEERQVDVVESQKVAATAAQEAKAQ